MRFRTKSAVQTHATQTNSAAKTEVRPESRFAATNVQHERESENITYVHGQVAKRVLLLAAGQSVLPA
jgi:hypothetical protein